MTYNIVVTPIEPYLFGVIVTVKEGKKSILCGETSVACETDTEAHAYAETVFLPDLRINYPRLIGDLVLDGDVVLEGEVE